MNRKKRDQSKWQEANINSVLFHIAKSRAKKKGIPFNIDKEDIQIPDICPVLKVPIDVSRNKGRQHNGASLDRFDSSLGYVKGNVWVISALANRMKQDASIEQLQEFAKWALTLKEKEKLEQ